MFTEKQANLARMGAFWLIGGLTFGVMVIALSSGYYAALWRYRPVDFVISAAFAVVALPTLVWIDHAL